MSALQFTVTKAGTAAFINAQNTGMDALVLSQAGVSTSHYAGSLADLTTLPSELKRISTIGGEAVADDTIHVTIQDVTATAYAARAFGIYLSDGTLFAVFSQATPIVEKSAAAMLSLGLDLTLEALGAVAITVGDLLLSNPPATESVAGVVEMATPAETAAGTRADRAVHPLGLARVLFAWAQSFAASAHTHAIEHVTGLGAQLQALTNAVAGKAAASHNHAASDVTSGVFNVGRIPALAIEKITGLAAALNGKAAANHNHSATDIVSGKLHTDRFLSEIPYATAFDAGLIELASDQQTIEGIGGTAAVTPEGFWVALRSSGRLMAANGHLKIPGSNLILQWGYRIVTLTEGDVAITYSTSFPNACVLLAGQINNSAGNAAVDQFVQGRGAPGLSSGLLRVGQIGSSASAPRIDWWALGY